LIYRFIPKKFGTESETNDAPGASWGIYFFYIFGKLLMEGASF